MAEWNLQETEEIARRVALYKQYCAELNNPRQIAPKIEDDCKNLKEIADALGRLPQAQGKTPASPMDTFESLEQTDSFALTHASETCDSLKNTAVDVINSLVESAATGLVEAPDASQARSIYQTIDRVGNDITPLFAQATCGVPGAYARLYRQAVPEANVFRAKPGSAAAQKMPEVSKFGPGVNDPEEALCEAVHWVQSFFPLPESSDDQATAFDILDSDYGATIDLAPTGVTYLADETKDSTFDAFLKKQGVAVPSGGIKTLGILADKELSGKSYFLGFVPIIVIIAVSGFLLGFGKLWIGITVALVVIKALSLLADKGKEGSSDKLRECLKYVPAYNKSRRELHQRALQATWEAVRQEAATDPDVAKRIPLAEQLSQRTGEEIASVARAVRSCADAVPAFLDEAKRANTTHKEAVRRQAAQMHDSITAAGFPLPEASWDQLDSILGVMRQGRARTLFDAQNVLVADARAAEEAKRNEAYRQQMVDIAQQQLWAQQEAAEAAQQAAAAAKEAKAGAEKAVATAAKQASASASAGSFFPPMDSCNNCMLHGSRLCIHPGRTNPCNSYIPRG